MKLEHFHAEYCLKNCYSPRWKPQQWWKPVQIVIFSTKIIQAFPNLLLFCSTGFSGIRKKKLIKNAKGLGCNIKIKFSLLWTIGTKGLTKPKIGEEGRHDLFGLPLVSAVNSLYCTVRFGVIQRV